MGTSIKSKSELAFRRKRELEATVVDEVTSPAERNRMQGLVTSPTKRLATNAAAILCRRLLRWFARPTELSNSCRYDLPLNYPAIY